MAFFLFPAVFHIVALVRTIFIERGKSRAPQPQGLHTLEEEDNDSISVVSPVTKTSSINTSLAVQLCGLCMFIIAACVFMLNGPEPMCSGTVTPLAAMGFMPLMVGVASRWKK